MKNTITNSVVVGRSEVGTAVAYLAGRGIQVVEQVRMGINVDGDPQIWMGISKTMGTRSYHNFKRMLSVIASQEREILRAVEA
tara:strand:- start:562 stop:810 length:249 start_codon:yes stop_codon:yes gene_type:complete